MAANTPLDPNSAGVVGKLMGFVDANVAAQSGPWINTSAYSTPVYTVPADQPPVSVSMDGGGPSMASAMSAVPIPSDARPAAGSDAEMTVYQPSSDTLWEFWDMRQIAGHWHAAWGGRILHESTDPGYYRNIPDAVGGYAEQADWGVTGSGLPVAGGLITLANLASGQIDHAVALMVPSAAGNVFDFPAGRTDGVDKTADAIPEGARLRLDPSLELSKLKLPPVTLMIAQAAQRYGLIVNDQTGGIVAFRAEDPTPLMRAGQPNPYNKYFLTAATGVYDSPTNFLALFPWSQLELVSSPPGP